jgi:hypothetical protein
MACSRYESYVSWPSLCICYVQSRCPSSFLAPKQGQSNPPRHWRQRERQVVSDQTRAPRRSSPGAARVPHRTGNHELRKQAQHVPLLQDLKSECTYTKQRLDRDLPFTAPLASVNVAICVLNTDAHAHTKLARVHKAIALRRKLARNKRRIAQYRVPEPLHALHTR